MRVRVFLDFDGVLNPETRPPLGAFADWCASIVEGVPVVWSPTVARSISQLADHAEVLWLTTWEQDAQMHLGPLMGLPRFELAGTDDSDAPWRWWKHDVVTALWQTDPRPFVWIDDDLAVFTEAFEWVQGLPPDNGLAVVPDPSVGLTPEHLAIIERFIAFHERTPDLDRLP
jgi:HAD domain in Swiss Army Knife RNA repair proteins